MIPRIMLATATALALGAAILHMPQDAPVARVATRAEYLASHPRAAIAMPVACTPAIAAPARTAAEI